MKKEISQKSYSYLLEGEDLYIKRARITLPYLVRQAKAGVPILYSDLAKEIGIPNPRNFNYILGAIGGALIELKKKTKREIPPIQCVVVNKATGFPGDGVGWFISNENFKKLTISQKRNLVEEQLARIFSFPNWDWVLKKLQLKPIETNVKKVIVKAKKGKIGGGESQCHKRFKNYIANNPNALKLKNNVGTGKMEYTLPSGDSIDVLFENGQLLIGVEVKSKISDVADIMRGLFQCVKYKYLLEAEQIVNDKLPNSRIILALESTFPNELILFKNLLGIEVKDEIK